MIKVTHVESFSELVSSVDTIVCKGRLVLINCSAERPAYNGELHSFKVKTNGKEPIIISKTEELGVGDKVKNSYQEIVDYTEEIEKLYGKNDSCFKKILALPENFSPKHLQTILDGKLKDGDEVLVECVLNYGNTQSIYPNIPYIKLSRDNHIKLFPVKKEESWDDILKRYKLTPYQTTTGNLWDWFKENYNPPTRK